MNFAKRERIAFKTGIHTGIHKGEEEMTKYSHGTPKASNVKGAAAGQSAKPSGGASMDKGMAAVGFKRPTATLPKGADKSANGSGPAGIQGFKTPKAPANASNSAAPSKGKI